MALLLVSHDLAVIAGHCDRVMVMYAGVIMESGPVERCCAEPRNPYTLALLEARPRPGAPRGARLADHSRRARRSRATLSRAARSPAAARSPSSDAGRRRRLWSPSARTMSRAVIGRAKWGFER